MSIPRNLSKLADGADSNGVLNANSGGTGQTSYAVGDILYASTTTALSKLADVATGNALISGGVGVVPSYGKIGLTTHVSGTLPIANGGTNSTATPTANGVIYGNGTAYAVTAAGTTGQVLTATTGSAPTWSTPSGGSAATPTVAGTVLGKTPASNTTAIGYRALEGLTSGTQNAAFGTDSGKSITTGNYNTCIGDSAGYGLVASQYVTMVGATAGQYTDCGNYNTYIGYANTPSSTTVTKEIVVGQVVTGKGTNTVTLGHSTNYVYLNYTTDNTWTRLSDNRLKTNVKPENTGLNFINKLSPVTFNWKPSFDIPKELTSQYREENEKNTETIVAGFIAQDVRKALDDSNATHNLGWGSDAEGIQYLSETMFILPLVNAVKELSAKLDALEAKHNAYVASHP